MDFQKKVVFSHKQVPDKGSRAGVRAGGCPAAGCSSEAAQASLSLLNIFLRVIKKSESGEVSKPEHFSGPACHLAAPKK